jgi:hypothetical protein
MRVPYALNHEARQEYKNRSRTPKRASAPAGESIVSDYWTYTVTPAWLEALPSVTESDTAPV